MANSSSLFSAAKDFIATHYANNPGKMLIHTGVIGWALSSVAQIFAIAINDKIPKKQKMFLVPQEFADACVNIASFYFVTSTFKSVASKLVTQGKWVPKQVAEFLKNKNFTSKIGKSSFNVRTDANLPEKLKQSFDSWFNGVDFISTTIGSVISCNIITPLLRNVYASKRQQSEIARMEKFENRKRPYFHTSMTDFQSRTNTYSSGSLKI